MAWRKQGDWMDGGVFLSPMFHASPHGNKMYVCTYHQTTQSDHCCCGKQYLSTRSQSRQRYWEQREAWRNSGTYFCGVWPEEEEEDRFATNIIRMMRKVCWDGEYDVERKLTLWSCIVKPHPKTRPNCIMVRYLAILVKERRCGQRIMFSA